ncbi:hypothetical protein J537_0715 [Acinetobacter baumannii 1437282]|nr:hypothetical protein J537_0715 [Acinetobacter baumannii 1437282]
MNRYFKKMNHWLKYTLYNFIGKMPIHYAEIVIKMKFLFKLKS